MILEFMDLTIFFHQTEEDGLTKWCTDLLKTKLQHQIDGGILGAGERFSSRLHIL